MAVFAAQQLPELQDSTDGARGGIDALSTLFTELL